MIFPFGEHVVGSPFEYVFRFLCINEPTNVTNARLVLHHYQPLYIFGQGTETRILQKIRIAGAVLWDFEVIPGMHFNHIIECCGDNGVPLVITLKAVVDVGEIFPDFDGSMQWLLSIKLSIGG